MLDDWYLLGGSSDTIVIVLIAEVMDDFNNLWQEEMTIEVWDKLERVFDYSIAFLWVK